MEADEIGKSFVSCTSGDCYFHTIHVWLLEVHVLNYLMSKCIIKLQRHIFIFSIYKLSTHTVNGTFKGATMLELHLQKNNNIEKHKMLLLYRKNAIIDTGFYRVFSLKYILSWPIVYRVKLYEFEC